MRANPQNIVNLLLKKGRALQRAPRQLVRFTGLPEADQLLNDLSGHPHAFVLACVMDRQIKAEKAWVIPYRFQEALETFEFRRLQKLTLREIFSLMTRPVKLHRYPKEMSRNFYEAVQLIATRYGGDAAAIWANRPSSAEVVHRMLGFRGVGPKIATMTANILARDFKIPLRDYYSIDISVDVQVRRVFSRLRLIDDGESIDRVIYLARALSPEYPGVLDFPTWEIGRKWCRPTSPDCATCYMNAVCPTGQAALT